LNPHFFHIILMSSSPSDAHSTRKKKTRNTKIILKHWSTYDLATSKGPKLF
jgi:hypothetical protein